MDGANFDPARWSHWLLIGCFVGMSVWGLVLSWQWRSSAKSKRQQAKLARRLAMELHGQRRSSPTEHSPIFARSYARKTSSTRTE